MIPVNEPLLDGREKEYVTDCLETGWISSAGKYIDEFEKGWAEYCGRRFGVAMSNGTTALQAAVRALQIGPGDEVILPSFTIVSCAMAVVYAGATPVLVDCDPETWTMDPVALAAAIGPKTKAIMPVHIYGHPCDMDQIMMLAERQGIAVIEDAAEAHGADYKGRRCGSFGDVSCFSFYANKIITTGEGGMALTDDEALAERLRSLRNLCFRSDVRFRHDELGFNFRLTNMQAAVGLAQVERADDLVDRKRRQGALYNELLAGIAGISRPVEREWATNVYWMYGLVVDEATGMDAGELAKRLRRRGIETRPFFLGMHEQPVFHEMGLFREGSFPVTERLARQGLYLPSGMALSEEQQAEVAAALRDAMAES